MFEKINNVSEKSCYQGGEMLKSYSQEGGGASCVICSGRACFESDGLAAMLVCDDEMTIHEVSFWCMGGRIDESLSQED